MLLAILKISLRTSRCAFFPVLSVRMAIPCRFQFDLWDTGISAVVVFLCDACFSSFTDNILGISYTNQLHLRLIQCSKISEVLFRVFLFPKQVLLLSGGHLVRNANASFRSASAWDSDE
ncbi:hypothetical protein T09_15395, partial [Trichinella sp. T9]